MYCWNKSKFMTFTFMRYKVHHVSMLVERETEIYKKKKRNRTKEEEEEDKDDNNAIWNLILQTRPDTIISVDYFNRRKE